MATITFTAANVQTANPSPLRGRSGGTILTGYFVYADSTDGGRLKAASNASAAAAAVVGMALSTAADEQFTSYVDGGTVTVQTGAFTGMAYGDPLFLSDTAGKCFAFGDREQGDYSTLLGYVTSSSTFVLLIAASGLQQGSIS